MLRNRRERGEGQFGCLVGLVLLLIAGIVAYKMIPIKVKAADLRETVVDEGRSAGARRDGPERIHGRIMAKAKQLGLPLTDDGITIDRSAASIHIEVTYTVPVEFPGFTYQWHFKHVTDNPIF